MALMPGQTIYLNRQFIIYLPLIQMVMPLIKVVFRQALLRYPNRGICLDPTEEVSKPIKLANVFILNSFFPKDASW